MAYSASSELPLTPSVLPWTNLACPILARIDTAMPIRKCRQLQKAVERYYRGQYLADDLALRTALAVLRTLPPSFGRFMGEVCLVADWGSIQNFTFDNRVLMATAIETSWPLLESLRNIHDDQFATETQLIVSAVDALSHTRLLQPPRRQLSFISKYLHLCINSAFPIWDTNARRALAHVNSQTTWDSYKEWVDKARQEADAHRVCLTGQALPDESLVRTLDKALYIIGQRVRDRERRLERSKKKLTKAKKTSTTAAQPVRASHP